MGKHKHKFSFRSTDFITYVWSKRKILLVISFIAAVISAIVSLTITPKFRSSVILFPASSASVSKSLLSDNNGQNDFLKFGTEQEGEQLMQILTSSRIREKLIKKYNLIRHYDIDTASAFWRTNLNNEYNGNIKIHRTEYMSIVIDVLDTDPDTAALIANSISNQVDTVMSQIQGERAQKALAIIEKEYQNKVREVNVLEDSLKKIRKLGVINYKSQSKALTEAYAEALLKGNTKGASVLEKRLNILAQYGGAYEALSQLHSVETDRLSSLHAKYVESKVDADQTVSHKFVVDKAYAAEKKAYPKRSLIVLVSTICTFFLTLLLLIIRDSIANKV